MLNETNNNVEKTNWKVVVIVFLFFLNAPLPITLIENWNTLPLIIKGVETVGSVEDILDGNDTENGHESIYQGKFIVFKDTFNFRFTDLSVIQDKSKKNLFKSDKIEILYDVNNPNTYIVNSFKNKYGAFIYTLVILCLDTLYLIYIIKKRKAKNLRL